MSGPTRTPLYLGTPAGPVFTFLHEPPPAHRLELGVVICGPFGWDDQCAYRSLREWADHLARAGHPALRLDLPGTGDSVGGAREPDLPGAWTAAVDAAVTRLLDSEVCARVAVIGVGLGGVVAARAAAEGAPIESLILWGTPSRGRAIVRQMRAFATLQAAGPVAGAALPSGGPAGGGLEAGGFLLTAETAAALEATDLSRAFAADGPLRRALLLERDGAPADARLRRSLESAGVEVTLSPGDGYGAMIAEPGEGRPPTRVFETVTDWLASDAPTAAHAVPALERFGAPTAEFHGPGGSVRERPIRLAGDTIFGILTEPVAGVRAPFTVVLTNPGAVRRIGPGRMWVEAARRWAALGVPTLRMDVAGIGDAAGDAARYSDVAELYRPDLVRQVASALDPVGRETGNDRFVLGGLCSGAFWDFHAALEDERIEALMLLNLQLFFWTSPGSDTEAGEAGSAHRRSFSPPRPHLRELPRLIRAVWRLVSSAGTWLPDPSARRRVLQRARRTDVHHEAETHRLGPGERLEEALDRLRRLGTRVDFIFSGQEPLHDELEESGRVPDSGRWPETRVEVVAEYGSHTLRPVWLQERVHDTLDQIIRRELGRV